MKRIFFAPDGRWRVGWCVVFFVVLTVVASSCFGLVRLLGPSKRAGVDDPRWAFDTWPALLGALTATYVTRRVFREETGFHSLTRVKDFFGGVLVSLALLAASILAPLMAGAISLRRSEAGTDELMASVAVQLVALGATAIAEEVMFRGVAFHALSRGTSPAVACVISACIFGVGHMFNPHVDFTAVRNIALVGGLFGLCTLRRSLWMSMGMHLAWNVGLGFVAGLPVSGIQPGVAVFRATWAIESGLWSGGNFGPEAAGWTTVVLLAAVGIVTVGMRHRAGSLSSEM